MHRNAPQLTAGCNRRAECQEKKLAAVLIEAPPISDHFSLLRFKVTCIDQFAQSPMMW